LHSILLVLETVPHPTTREGVRATSPDGGAIIWVLYRELAMKVPPFPGALARLQLSAGD